MPAASPPTRTLPADDTQTPVPAATVTQSPAEAQTAAEKSARTGTASVPGYDVIEELGRGGMGIVYKARQVTLNRTVALKVVLGERADAKSLIRFLAEAEAVAAVKHPNVVEVYEYGEAGGRQYLSLEFLPGGTLDDRIGGPDRKSLPPVKAAALIARIARGVAAAHDQGIVHRDLKPANVLFDAAGEPKVTDFGLAKKTTGPALTRTQAVMGTPAYMAPEQARGDTRFVGPQADVYALGVILYEALTGSRPFVADDSISLLCKVVEDDPPPPRDAVPGLSPDIERVCLKCLEKSPADRYPTAGALADDLARFVAGESVSVRAPGRVERLTKWARRKPTLAAAYALSAIVACLVGVTVGMVGLWQQAVAERENAEETRDLAQRLELKSDFARREAEKHRAQAEAARDGEKAALLHVSRLNYAHSIRLAQADLEADNPACVRDLLDQCPAEFRDWEWYFLERAMTEGKAKPKPGPVASRLGVVPAGQDLPPVAKAALRKVLDDRATVVASGDTIRVSPPGPGKRVVELRGMRARITAAVFSPDGKTVLTAGADNAARLWDAAAGTERVELHGHTKPVQSVAYSPDGSRVVTTAGDQTARVWDPVTGKELIVLRGGPGGVKSAAFSPDGRQVLVTDSDGGVRVFDGTPVAQVSK